MSAPPVTQAAPQVIEEHDPALWREGVKTGLPTLFGIAAWGMVVGIAMVKTGLTVLQASGMTLLVFAGSAQLAALPLIIGIQFLIAFLHHDVERVPSQPLSEDLTDDPEETPAARAG